MSEHSEILNKARVAADVLTEVVPTRPAVETAATMLRAFANLVERQGKVIAETVAACVTCDETIGEFLVAAGLAKGDEEALMVLRRGSVTLDTARRRAERAAKLGEPEAQVEATIVLTQAEYDDLMKRLGGTTNLPPEPPVHDDRVQGTMRVPTNAELREWARNPDNQPPDWWWNATDDVFTAEPAPAVEIEMRCGGHALGGWAWQACIGNHWIEPRHADEGHAFAETKFAVGDGNAWLTALSAQLGVPLVAVWKEGEV